MGLNRVFASLQALGFVYYCLHITFPHWNGAPWFGPPHRGESIADSGSSPDQNGRCNVFSLSGNLTTSNPGHSIHRGLHTDVKIITELQAARCGFGVDASTSSPIRDFPGLYARAHLNAITPDALWLQMTRILATTNNSDGIQFAKNTLRRGLRRLAHAG